MKVIFDHLCFWQRYGGVPRYFVELYKHLPKQTVEMTVRFSDNEYLRSAGLKVRPFAGRWEFRGRSRLEKQWGKIFSIARLMRRDYDVYHQTHYDCYAYRFLSPSVGRVTTLHDANYFTHAAHYNPRSSLRREMIRSAELADHIITVSNYSKQKICHYLGCAEQKVSVIYHGIDHALCRQAEPLATHERYILYVGARNVYKNFSGLCDAFALARLREPSLRLYCCGAQSSKAEREMLYRKGIEDKVRFLSPTDSELFSLYKSARCFVFPSFAEGFGLPIIEAMAAGCPTLLAERSCFPEIAGTAAQYFNPEDVEEMCDKILECSEEGSLRERLIAAGRARAAQFTWRRSAEEHMKIYNTLRR